MLSMGVWASYLSITSAYIHELAPHLAIFVATIENLIMSYLAIFVATIGNLMVAIFVAAIEKLILAYLAIFVAAIGNLMVAIFVAAIENLWPSFGCNKKIKGKWLRTRL